MQSTTSLPAATGRSNSDRKQIRFELICFAVVLALANAPLLVGNWHEPLVFFPALVGAGEWWRIITHPFVHVSWYHLLLDGAAFLMLYAELRHWPSWRRLGAVAASAASSLAAATSSPLIASDGFCGLSGIAHGLMAISAVEMIGRGDLWGKRVGWCALLLVVGKVLMEAASGEVVLSLLHFGLMGVPIAACHAGGVIGGLAFAFITLHSSIRTKARGRVGRQWRTVRLRRVWRRALVPWKLLIYMPALLQRRVKGPTERVTFACDRIAKAGS